MPEKTLFEGALIFQLCVEPFLHKVTSNEAGVSQRAFKLNRRAVIQRGVQALAVVYLFDEPLDGVVRVSQIAILLTVNFLVFQSLYK